MSEIPRLFTTEPFDAAATRAETESKWLLIDFTAAWCGPCQNMERTTWRAPDVEAWVAAKAIAVQVDVDVQKDIAQRFGVQAMPTMVMLKAGKEVDRAVGAQSAKQLLSWLGGLEQGKTLLDAQVEAAKNGGPQERFRLAQELLMRGRFEDAAEHALWFWEHAVEAEPELVGVRFSYGVELLKDLVFQVPSLKDKLVVLRDAAEDKKPDDFLALNRVLGAPERSLAWFERVKGKGQRLDRHQELVGLLIEREQWAELGGILAEPLVDFERAVKMRDEVLGEANVPEEMKGQLSAMLRANLVQTAGTLVKALRAAKRDDDAAKLQQRALEADGSEEMKRAVS
jgi:thioredoxin-like negative regulator of GroEL